MPRYLYKCENCDNEKTVFHRLNEVLEDCDECEATDTLKKIIGTPYISKAKNPNKEKVTGQITKEFIRENRKILDEQKKEIREKKHDKT